MQMGIHCGRISVMTDYQPGGGGPPPPSSFLLLETGAGNFLLLEAGGKIIL